MTEIQPPILYSQSRAAAVLYAIALETAEMLLDGTGLVAVNLGGFGIVNAAWFDYGASSIGPYREFSIGIMASRERLRISAAANLLRGRAGSVGAFILALPVDSEVARSGGVALYGLPKTRLDLALRWSPRRLDAAPYNEEGKPIFSMQLPLGFGVPCWVRQLLIYSRIEGRILATSISTSWFAQIDLVGRPRLTVENRHHPIGQLVTSLGLESARPLAIVHGKLQYAELPPPTRSC